jgi:hypothetical protein
MPASCRPDSIRSESEPEIAPLAAPNRQSSVTVLFECSNVCRREYDFVKNIGHLLNPRVDTFTLGMLVGALLMLCLIWAYYAPS